MDNSGLLIYKWCELNPLGKGRIEDDSYTFDFELPIGNSEGSVISYQVRIKEKYVEVRIRPILKGLVGKSDIKPKEYFSGEYAVNSYSSFLRLVNNNKDSVLDYLDRVREKDECN